MEPRGERAAGVEAVDRREGPLEGVLRDVVGQSAAAGDGEGGAPCRGPVAPEERRRRLPGAGAHAAHELAVGGTLRGRGARGWLRVPRGRPGLRLMGELHHHLYGARGRSRPGTDDIPGGAASAGRPGAGGGEQDQVPSAAARRRRAVLRDQPDRVLVWVVLGLVSFGLVMVYSASSAPAILSEGNPLRTVTRQAVYALVGLGAYLVASRMRPDSLRRIGPLMLAVSGFLLLAVLMPGIGTVANGSRRWISLGAFNLQPSELAKIGLALWIAQAIAREPKRLASRGGLIPYLALTAAFGGLILLEPDLGTAMVLTAMALAMLIVGGARASRLAAAMGAGVGLVLLAIAIEPYRRERLLAFLDPWADPQGAGFQVVQAQVAIGSGGPFGVGLGNGIQKANYLPEAHTDMILATVGEELGVVGIVLVLVAFGALVVAGYRIALSARDLHGQVLAVGVTTLVAAQAIVNVGAVLGFLPVTGVPLPFVSFGGSSLIVLLFAAGILVNIGRRPSRGSPRLRLVGRGDATGAGGDRRGRDGRPRDARAGGGGRAVGARG
jgi:cell division protein FtsW